MITEALIGLVATSIGALVWFLKKQTEGLDKISRALERLALSVQYCPMNKKNHDIIKQRFFDETK